MIIEKPFEQNDVVTLKLSNGDELIARFASLTESQITISKPMLMVLGQDPRTGQPGIQIVPFWMVGGEKDGKYPINRNHVLCMVKANAEAAKGYMAHTTGLTIPGSGIIK